MTPSEAIEDAKAALKPFAAFETAIRNTYESDPDNGTFYSFGNTFLNFGDFRRASRALAALSAVPAVSGVTEEERAQATVIDQLEEALRRMIYETTSMSPLEDDGSHKCIISKAALEAARQAYHQGIPTLRAQSVPEGWRTIESAPKDGTQILACQQFSEHLTAQGYVPDLSIVKWDDREKDFVAMADGYMSIKSQGDTWTTYHEPYVTHWQPLPTPPANQVCERKETE